MMKNMFRKSLVIGAVILFVTTSFIPASSQFTKIDVKDESQTPYENSKSENAMATVYLKKYDRNEGKLAVEPLKKITLEEALQLKEELLSIEERYDSSKEKIREQINVMHKWDVLSENVTFEEFLTVIEGKEHNSRLSTSSSSVTPSVMICGPVITSFLSVGGPMIPLHVFLFNLLPPLWYNVSQERLDILNGTRIAKFYGILPLVAFYCSSMTLINAFGAVVGENSVFSPFVAIMVLHAGAGISISIFDDGFPTNILDWSIGVSATGLIAYLSM